MPFLFAIFCNQIWLEIYIYNFIDYNFIIDINVSRAMLAVP